MISPASPRPKPNERTLRLILLPYASCFTNTRDHVKTTMPIAAHMRRLHQIAYPTFEIQTAHPMGSPTHSDLKPFVEEIVQAEFGPLASEPTRLFADRMYTYHPEERTLVVLVCVPFPARRTPAAADFEPFVQRIAAWSTDPTYYPGLSQVRVLDFALLADFALGIVRPWHYNQVLPRAYYFWQLLIPRELARSGRWALLAFAGPYFRNSVRWQWKEARPYLGAAIQVIADSPASPFSEEHTAPRELEQATIIPFTPLPPPTKGWAGFSGLARSILVAAHVTPPELREQRHLLGMSWPTWLSLWRAEGLSDKAMLLWPQHHTAPKVPAPGKPIRESVVGQLREETEPSPKNPPNTARRGAYSAYTRATWQPVIHLIDNCPVPMPDWSRTLAKIEAHEYEPSRAVDSPAIHAPFEDANLRVPVPRCEHRHPQPVVIARSRKPFPKSTDEAWSPRRAATDDQSDSEGDAVDPEPSSSPVSSDDDETSPKPLPWLKHADPLSPEDPPLPAGYTKITNPCTGESRVEYSTPRPQASCLTGSAQKTPPNPTGTASVSLTGPRESLPSSLRAMTTQELRRLANQLHEVCREEEGSPPSSGPHPGNSRPISKEVPRQLARVPEKDTRGGGVTTPSWILAHNASNDSRMLPRPRATCMGPRVHMPGTCPTSPRALLSRHSTTPTSPSLRPPYPMYPSLSPSYFPYSPERLPYACRDPPGHTAPSYHPSEPLPRTPHDYPEHLAPSSQMPGHLPPTCRDPADYPARLPHPSERLTRPHYDPPRHPAPSPQASGHPPLACRDAPGHPAHFPTPSRDPSGHPAHLTNRSEHRTHARPQHPTLPRPLHRTSSSVPPTPLPPTLGTVPAPPNPSFVPPNATPARPNTSPTSPNCTLMPPNPSPALPNTAPTTRHAFPAPQNLLPTLPNTAPGNPRTLPEMPNNVPTLVSISLTPPAHRPGTKIADYRHPAPPPASPAALPARPELQEDLGVTYRNRPIGAQCGKLRRRPLGLPTSPENNRNPEAQGVKGVGGLKPCSAASPPIDYLSYRSPPPTIGPSSDTPRIPGNPCVSFM